MSTLSLLLKVDIVVCTRHLSGQTTVNPVAFLPVGSVTMISPLELIRTKLQSQKQSYRELSACIRSAVEAGGWLSLWRGWGPTLLRDVPFSAMYWYNYERGKAWMCDRYGTTEPTFTITFLSGAASGSVSRQGLNSVPQSSFYCKLSRSVIPFVWSMVYFQIASIVTLPFDVVKTRRQVELGELQALNCNNTITHKLLTFFTGF